MIFKIHSPWECIIFTFLDNKFTLSLENLSLTYYNKISYI